MGNALRKFDSNEFKKAYDIKETLGQGSFATVKKAIHRKTKKVYAIKIIKKDALSDEDLKVVHDEVKIMRTVEHENCVHLFDMMDSPKKVYMVLELLSGGELFERIVEKGSFSEKDAADVMVSLVGAIQYLHSVGIVHRDLKPENIIYESDAADAKVKVTDFGLAKLREGDDRHRKMATACGTPGYVAPEVLKGQQYGPQVDIWSLGVILYILLSGCPPFYSENTSELYKQIKSGKYSFKKEYWGGISDDAIDLVKRMLTVDPDKRISCEEILAHTWMSNASPEKFSAGYITNLKLVQARARLRRVVRTLIVINRFAMQIQNIIDEDKEAAN